MTDESKLKDVRNRIDKLDQQLLELISERARCAQEVARIKGKDDPKAVFYRAEREAQILRTILEKNQGPLRNEEMARLFREIMSACLALEMPMKVAFLGPEGTFTQAAALKHFGHSISTVPMASIDAVFREVESGNVHYGVVPVENSTEGMVSHTLDLFINSPLHISGEVEVRIHQHLMGLQRDLSQIDKIYSHRQSFAQCREWLNTNAAGIERIEVFSNAEAARLAKLDAKALAIAGESAAEIYGLQLVVSNIEDEPDNTTRFLVIGANQISPSGDDKTSLLISAPNRPGSLYQLLEAFARNNVSMTRIESRPSRRGMWDYVFFVDVDGHIKDTKVTQALSDLAQTASIVKVLGSYPKAVL